MMKQLFFAIGLSLLCLNSPVLAQTTKKKPKTTKDADGIDGRMRGPNGETVYIGQKGGRFYYSNSGQKVYLPYAKDKKKKQAIKKAVKSLMN